MQNKVPTFVVAAINTTTWHYTLSIDNISEHLWGRTTTKLQYHIKWFPQKIRILLCTIVV